MHTVLILEDDKNRITRFRSAYPHASIVETAADAINLLKSGKWDTVFLDHDLGGEVMVDSSNSNTGSAVVRFVVEHKPGVGEFIVHSLNPVAGDNMASDLRRAGYKTTRWPFNAAGLR